MASCDWAAGFLCRHPELSIRKAQAISYGRAMCLAQIQVDVFFDAYETLVEQLDLPGKLQSIYNADDSGLQHCFIPNKIIAGRGAKIVQQVTNAEKGVTTTVMACCNAIGNFIPPFVVFKGKRKKSEFSDAMPPGTIVYVSESGYINLELFTLWLQHFQMHRSSGPVILLLDGHCSHVNNEEALSFAEKCNINLLCLPPHTTHFLQPLDRSFFKPLKSAFNQACGTWIRNHPGRGVTKLTFGNLFAEAWGRAATVSTGGKGFRACRIYPVNRPVIPEAAMAPSEVSFREAAPSTSSGNENMTVSTPKRKYTKCEASASSTSASSSTVSFEEISPIPEMERNSSKRRSKYRPVLRASRVSNTSQRAAGRYVTRKQLRAESNRRYGSVGAGKNYDYCKECGGFYYDRSHKYFSDEWLKCHKCQSWYHESCCGGKGKKRLVCKSCL
jgi:transposase